jgi:hypothetical protein
MPDKGSSFELVEQAKETNFKNCGGDMQKLKLISNLIMENSYGLLLCK